LKTHTAAVTRVTEYRVVFNKFIFPANYGIIYSPHRVGHWNRDLMCCLG